MAGSTESTKENGFFSFLRSFLTRPEPYDLIRIIPEYVDIEENNPFKERILFIKENKYMILQILNNDLKEKRPQDAQITEQELIALLKYLVPKEMKATDAVNVTDGQVTYTELQKIANDVENVSPSDVSFGEKMPRIFIMPKPPEKDSRERQILGVLPSNGLAYFPSNDSIVIESDFVIKIDSEQFKAAFAHEYGHRLDSATRGYMEAKYNAGIHASSLLSGDNLENCAKYIINGQSIDNGNECYHAKEIIDNHKKKSADPKIEKINAWLERDREAHADLYAVLAGYGNGFIRFFENNIQPDIRSHPSSVERSDRAGQIIANPNYYKKELEGDIALFRKHISMQTDSDNMLKPSQTPNLNLEVKQDIAQKH